VRKFSLVSPLQVSKHANLGHEHRDLGRSQVSALSASLGWSWAVGRRLVYLSISRLFGWLRLSGRSESWKTVEVCVWLSRRRPSCAGTGTSSVAAGQTGPATNAPGARLSAPTGPQPRLGDDVDSPRPPGL